MDSELQTFLIPDELSRRAGIAATCCPINETTIFPYEKKTIKQKDVPSKFASNDPTIIHQLRQDCILFQPILRKLVNESNAVFLNMQRLITSEKSTEMKDDLLALSRQYRSTIRACLENLQDEIQSKNKPNDPNHIQSLQDYVTIFYSVECIWHLCEILFVDVIPGNVVLPLLLEWIRFHFPKHERNAATMLAGDLVGLESNSEYWSTVFGALLQGRVKVVRGLLRLHSASDSHLFKLADQILRAMPTYSISSGMSVTEFNMQWRQWTVDVQSKIDAQSFTPHQQLSLIMRLIVGEEAAWAEIQNQCETWYELLAGWLFYTEPTVKSFELGEFAKRCISKMRLENHMKHLDRALLAALEFDVLQIIKEIQDMSENGWFVTHLTDLLYHSGRLSNIESEIENFSAQKLHESFILDYGILLMGHHSLWQVGLSYLDYCPNDGLQTIELLLPRIHLQTEAKTLKVIREANIRDLTAVAQTICKVQGMRSLNRGRLGNALTWALKSQDGPFISYLADKFLKDYTKTGKFEDSDLLNNLGASMLASDRLIFLGKYYEFHKLYEEREYREAASLLISLLGSKIIPKYFWYILLIETIPLLESEELVFTSYDTFSIMHCLEEKEDLPELKDHLDIIRLAAARNLSRALTYEAQL